MALRKVVTIGENVLRKQSKAVTSFDEKLATLIDDMFETMYKEEGVGLAAPQVGILKRVVVIDTGENKVELVNPVITKTEGEQICNEGCLSVPDVRHYVKRPNYVECQAFDRTGKEIFIKAEGLFAEAICHEVDHLNGILFVDLEEQPKPEEKK